jgi:hypothetical protein
MALPQGFNYGQILGLDTRQSLDVLARQVRLLGEQVFSKTITIVGVKTDQVSVTGTGILNREDLLTVPFAAGQLGKQGLLWIRAVGTVGGTNGAKALQLACKDGSGTYHELAIANYTAGQVGLCHFDISLANAGSEASQHSLGFSIHTTTEILTNQFITLSINTAATGTAASTAQALSIVLRGSRANSGDTVQSYSLMVLRAPSLT